MEKQDLDQSIDFKLSEEFDALILSDFALNQILPFAPLKPAINIASERPKMFGAVSKWIPNRVSLLPRSSIGEEAYPPVSITISGSYAPSKPPKWFSFTDFCAIFFPQDRFEITADWKKTLVANLKVLREDLPNLYQREISVSIATQDIIAKVPNFWDKPESTLKHHFYENAYPIIQMIVAKAVSDITLVARWGSDSPYQRFMEADKWGLISFRFTKRQQIDIVQYVEAKKIRFKCALIDLGFLENGYGKVAKIKEVISTEVDLNAAPKKSRRFKPIFWPAFLKTCQT